MILERRGAYLIYSPAYGIFFNQNRQKRRPNHKIKARGKKYKIC